MTDPGWARERERGSAWLLRLALLIAFSFGWHAGRLLLFPITAWFLATSPRARSASRDFLGRVLERPPTGWDVARHIHTFACVILDRLFLAAGRTQRFRIATSGLEHVQSILAQGRGCVLLGAHLGSFEVLRLVGTYAPVPVRPVMFRRNAGALTRVLDQLDPALRESVIEIGDTASMLRVHEAVDQGEIVGLLADRAPEGHRLVAARFLGGTARFPAGPWQLAAALGAPVVLFHAVRVGPRRYHVSFEPFAERVTVRRTSRLPDLALWVGRYAEALERVCREHPYNWFNFFPFWESATDADPAPPRPDRGSVTRDAGCPQPGAPALP